MTLLEEFSKGLEGQDLNQLIHEAKAESENRLGQGVAYLALFISEVIVKAMSSSGAAEFRHLFSLPIEQPPRPPLG
jgi:hypothetical protein